MGENPSRGNGMVLIQCNWLDDGAQCLGIGKGNVGGVSTTTTTTTTTTLPFANCKLKAIRCASHSQSSTPTTTLSFCFWTLMTNLPSLIPHYSTPEISIFLRVYQCVRDSCWRYQTCGVCLISIDCRDSLSAFRTSLNL